MYHPSRGGVRGGRDQFKWDDVKVDKHRENYLGHSVKAPVGRWQKGKDLFWYSKDKHAQGLEQAALKDEIQRVKEEEEQLMREALGLAPKRSNRPQGNRLDKHEFSELVKRGSTAEDLGGGHADAAKVDGLGFARAPRVSDMSTSVLPGVKDVAAKTVKVSPEHMDQQEEPDKEIKQKKRKRDEKRHDKHEERKHKKHEKHEKRHSRDSKDKSSSRDSKGKSSSRDTKDKSKHRKDKEKRRHDSDSE